MTWFNRWLIETFPAYGRALKYADPRTQDWFLLGRDPTGVIILTITYLIIVLFGPRFMHNRAPVHIPSFVLFIYNMSLVILSAYMVEEIIVGMYRRKYNLLCEKMTVTNDEDEMKITRAMWFYFFSKAIEFLDTILMVIRKRYTQITFLHVFHHSTMLNIWWIVMTWIPGGQAWLGPVLNSSVHVVMYSYYGLSVIPSLRDKLWWKKYITIFQLLQFLFIFTHTLQGLVRDCQYPRWGQWMLGGYMIIMLILFTNFFIHEYITQTNEAKRRRQKHSLSSSSTIPTKNNKHDKKIQRSSIVEFDRIQCE